MTTVYSVWIENGGDMFKGYNNTYVSSHLDKSVANAVAKKCNGYVEDEEDNLHPDYIKQLQESDIECMKGLIDRINTIINS